MTDGTEIYGQPAPRRGDEVEAWIKRFRDHFDPTYQTWQAIDLLLDDYREHADTGTPLYAEIQRS